MTDGAHRRAAIAFLLGALFFAYAFVLRVSPSVMVDDLMRDFAVGGAVLGNLSAFYFYAYSGLQIPVGLLLDRFGTRWLMTAAAAVVAGGTLLFASADATGSAYLGRLLIGAGCAFSWAGTLALVNQWFPGRFALLAGASQLVAMGGAILGQAPLALTVEGLGWRDTMAWLALIGIVLAVLICVVARDRLRHKRDDTLAGRSGVRAVAANPQTWLAAGFGLAMTSPMLGFGALWGVPYLIAVHEVERTTAAAVASLVFLGNGVGGVLFGWWSDRIHMRKHPMLVGGLLCVGAQLSFLLAPGLPIALVATLVFAAGVGGSTMVLAFAVAREHNSLASAGFTIGIINTAVTGSGALLQPLLGWILDTRWDGLMVGGARSYSPDTYQIALLVVPAIGVIGLGLLAFIRDTGATQQR